VTGQAAPATLADATTAAEVAQQYGLLRDDLAVFGDAVATEPLPRWAYDPAETASRRARKDDSGLGPATWRAVANLVHACAVLTVPASGHALERRLALEVATTLVDRLTTALARPPVAVIDPPRLPRDEPLDVVDAWLVGGIEAAAVRLCRALDDSGWTDPDELAGWVADTRDAVHLYAATTHRARSPRPRQPSTPPYGCGVTIPSSRAAGAAHAWRATRQQGGLRDEAADGSVLARSDRRSSTRTPRTGSKHR
jgi:hypothetical protein